MLGLRSEPDTEFAAPYGLIRSQALTGAVRIALNAAVLRRGEWAPAVEAPQHVAFLTDDAIATAQFASVRGAFKFNSNHMPIQDFFAGPIVEDGAGQSKVGKLDIVFKDHQDPFASACNLAK